MYRLILNCIQFLYFVVPTRPTQVEAEMLGDKNVKGWFSIFKRNNLFVATVTAGLFLNDFHCKIYHFKFQSHGF